MSSVRISDVARRAGVSSASVSRVLNAPERVRPALRHQVEAALAELRYLPHGPARALATQRSRTVGAVVPTLDIGIFSKGLAGLQDRLFQAGYTLLVASADYDLGREEAALRGLLGRGVDGLVLVGLQRAPEVEELLGRVNVPVVTTYLFEPAAGRPCVGIDNRGAARRVTEHLLELGHRDFAVLTSPHAENDRIAARLLGVRDGLAAAGLSLAEEAVVEVPYSITDGRAGLRSALAAGSPATALVCTTDVLALGALAEARAQGIAVPQELSITGFDDLDPAAHLDPPLTTVHVPAGEIGRRTADWLLARLAGRTTPERVELPASLILRRSTGRAPSPVRALPPPPAFAPPPPHPGGNDAALSR